MTRASTRGAARAALRAGFVAALTTAGTAQSASTHYVAPGGDDGGPGTLASPWRSLEHAVAQLGPR